MNTLTVGTFLSELRREKGMTQEELGEKIGVTNKTISRWENGNYMPPIDALQTLSELYEISINEILCGKRLEEAEYKKAAENNIKEALSCSAFSLKDKIDFFKKKWRKDYILSITLEAIIFVIAFVAGCIWDSRLIPGVLVIAFGWGIFKYNQMMVYVEKNAYDGSGKTKLTILVDNFSSGVNDEKNRNKQINIKRI